MSVVVLLALIAVPYHFLYTGSAETIRIQVVDKYETTKISRSSEGRVTSKTVRFVDTKDETFKNVDTVHFLKWDSSDLHRKLDAGETYTVLVAGCRLAGAVFELVEKHYRDS